MGACIKIFETNLSWNIIFGYCPSVALLTTLIKVQMRPETYYEIDVKIFETPSFRRFSFLGMLYSRG